MAVQIHDHGRPPRPSVVARILRREKLRLYTLATTLKKPPPRMAVQRPEILNQSGSQLIQVDISNQFLQICILLTDNGLVTVLKSIAVSAMALVGIDHIPREKPAHAGQYAVKADNFSFSASYFNQKAE